MNTPFFSIIIPTYNRANLILKTLQSVLEQKFDDFEVIIVDDGSTDNTQEIFKKSFPKTTYYRKNNEERAAARNYGIMRAKGAFITFLDSDDLLYPNHLEEAKNIIETNKNAVFISLAYEMKNDKGLVLWQQNTRKGNLNDALLKGNHLSCMGVFVEKEVMQENLFNENRDLSGTEDWECWMRLASRYPIFYTNTITATMIQHDSRSVLEINKEKLIKRINLAFDFLEKDAPFMQKYASRLPIAKAHLWLYVSLHLMMAKFKKDGLKYLIKSLIFYPPAFFTKKVIVILSKIFID